MAPLCWCPRCQAVRDMRLSPSLGLAACPVCGGGVTRGYHYERGLGGPTNREVPRLRPFPDWFVFVDSAREVRSWADGVASPLLAKRIGGACAAALGETPAAGAAPAHSL